MPITRRCRGGDLVLRPAISIAWPVAPDAAILSEKDRALPCWKNLVAFRFRENLMPRRFLVTGGAGFIGSAVVRHLIRETPHEVAVVDKLTYAGNLDLFSPVSDRSVPVLPRGHHR